MKPSNGWVLKTMIKYYGMIVIGVLIPAVLFAYGSYKLDSIKPLPNVKCFTTPVDKKVELKYPTGSFEHEQKSTI